MSWSSLGSFEKWKGFALETAWKYRSAPTAHVSLTWSLEPLELEGLRRSVYKEFVADLAGGPEEGLAKLRSSGRYAVVVSDMRMPGGAGGAEVYAWLTINRPELKNKILFITGDTVNEETLKALNDTGVPYIEKPFRMSELMAVVEKLFGRAR